MGEPESAGSMGTKGGVQVEATLASSRAGEPNMYSHADPISKRQSRGVAAVISPPNNFTEFPKDVEAIAEIIVRTFEDSDDLELLHRMICKAIVADRVEQTHKRKATVRKHKDQSPEARLERQRKYDRKHREKKNREQPSYEADRCRRRRARRKSEDAAGYAERERINTILKHQTHKDDPVYRARIKLKGQIQARKRWCRDHPDRLLLLMEIAVPKTYGAAMRAELIQMLTERYMTGSISRETLKDEVKSVVAAYWKVNPSKFGPQSLDAERFDDGNSTLHDTVSKGLWQ